MLLLCYFIVRVDTILAVGSRYPETNEFGTVFCLFFDQFEPGRVRDASEPGFSSRRRKPCFESRSTTLFQASWLPFEAFSPLMRIGFLYYNCLGFDLASDYTDIIPNTV